MKITEKWTFERITANDKEKMIGSWRQSLSKPLFQREKNSLWTHFRGNLSYIWWNRPFFIHTDWLFYSGSEKKITQSCWALRLLGVNGSKVLIR